MEMKGFTLIELLIVLAIVGLLSRLALPIAELDYKRKHEQELLQNLREIRHAIDLYKQASDTNQISKRAGASGYPPTLDSLIEGAEDQKDPKHQKIFFLRRLPRDPFVKNSALSNADTWGKRSYVSEASDPQEGEDVYDVYSVSTETGLNGIPYSKW